MHRTQHSSTHSIVDTMSPIPYHHSSISSSAAPPNSRGETRPPSHNISSVSNNKIAADNYWHYSDGSGGGSQHNTSNNIKSVNTLSAYSAGATDSYRQQQQELTVIQNEIAKLKERRMQLESQRNQIRGGKRSSQPASLNTSSVHNISNDSNYNHRAQQHQRTSSVRRPVHNAVLERPQTSYEAVATHLEDFYGHTEEAGCRSDRSYTVNQMQISRARSAGGVSVKRHHVDHSVFLPSEKERRLQQSVVRNVYRDMKEAMKASWDADTALIGGYFNVKDNPRAGTFGRERRFINPSGMTYYYLGTDVERMQEFAKSKYIPHYSVGNRGKSGCNVNSHWNDSKGGAAPGPGAYTPRYQKLASPSILTQIH